MYYQLYCFICIEILYMEEYVMKRVFVHLVLLLFLSIPYYAIADNIDFQQLYNEAENLLASGDYLGAAMQFDSIAQFADASQMAMYCKALYCAENNQFDLAISTLKSMGDFRDAPYLSRYYSARIEEVLGKLPDLTSADSEELISSKKHYNNAIDIYNSVLLFKDSISRVQSCQIDIAAIEAEEERRLLLLQDELYQSALSLEYEALQMFKEVAVPFDETIFYHYESMWRTVLLRYEDLITYNYKDSALRAQFCNEQLKEGYYRYSLYCESNGFYSDAADIYMSMQDYKDCAARLIALDEHKYNRQEGYVYYSEYEDIIRVDKDGKTGYVDENGNIISDFQWKSGSYCAEGMIAVCNEKGKWGFINKQGELVIPCTYVSVGSFVDGYCAVTTTSDAFGYDDWLIIDKSNNVIQSISDAKSVLVFSKDYYKVVKKTSSESLYSMSGEHLIGPYRNIYKVDGNIAFIERINRHDYETLTVSIYTGEEIFYGSWDGSFSEGYVKTNLFYLNEQFVQLPLPEDFKPYTPFVDGLAIIEKNCYPDPPQRCIIDLNGNIVCKLTEHYGSVRNVGDGYFVVSSGTNQFGVINSANEIIIPLHYAISLSYTGNDLFISNDGFCTTAYNSNNKILATAYRGEILEVEDGIVKFHDYRYWRILDAEGNLLNPVISPLPQQ